MSSGIQYSHLYDTSSQTSRILTHEDQTLKRVFDIYCIVSSCPKTKPFMNLISFTTFLKDLSKFETVLQDKSDEFFKAFFTYVDENCDNKIYFGEFTCWWKGDTSTSQTTRYKPFADENKDLFMKAWRLYNKFTIGHFIPYRRFKYVMNALNIQYSDYDFDIIDTNSDGVISFSEFCEWLKWF